MPFYEDCHLVTNMTLRPSVVQDAVYMPQWGCSILLVLARASQEGRYPEYVQSQSEVKLCDCWICWKYMSSRVIRSTAQAISWHLKPGFSLVKFGAISQHCEQKAFVSKACGARAWSLLLFFITCTWEGAMNGHKGGGCVGQGVLHVKSSCCLSTSSLWCVCLFILICTVVIFKCNKLLHKCEL